MPGRRDIAAVILQALLARCELLPNSHKPLASGTAAAFGGETLMTDSSTVAAALRHDL